jgi:hypothetical protein
VIKLIVGTCANYMIIIFLEGNNNLLVWVCMYMWWCLNSCMCLLSRNFYQSLLQWKHAHSYTRRWHKLVSICFETFDWWPSWKCLVHHKFRLVLYDR